MQIKTIIIYLFISIKRAKIKKKNRISVRKYVEKLEPSYLSGGGGLVTKSCPTLVTPWTGARQATWDFPGKNTGVDCHVLL